MTTIDNNKKICTLINVFTVVPEKQIKVFQLLKEATEKVMSRMPGYISANLHLSDDKKTVTNYAQWASLEDFHQMSKDKEVQAHMKELTDISIDIKPLTYNEIWSHSK